MRSAIVLLVLITFFIIIINPSIVYADEEGSHAESLLGRIVDIQLSGEFTTHPGFIEKQMTVERGDFLSESDIELSDKRLNELGYLYYVHVWYEYVDDLDNPPEIDDDLPEAPDGVKDLVVFADIYQDTTLYVYPDENGVSIGDTDIFNSGLTLGGGYYQAGEYLRLWNIQYTNPQFLGSHNEGTFTRSHMEDRFGVRDEIHWDLGERYMVNMDSYKFNLSTRFREDYRVNFGVEWQENATSFYEGALCTDTELDVEPDEELSEDNIFFLSEEDYSPGDELILSLGLSFDDTEGDPWTLSGSAWAIGAEQSFKSLGSDHNFGRYNIMGSTHIPVESFIDTVVLFGQYSFVSGKPPHYQKPSVGYIMRGHEGMDYFGDSTILLSGEVRRRFWDDKAMIVGFADFGKGFESHKLTLNNLDPSIGVGLRLDMERFWGWDFILRIDYAQGMCGERLTIGVGESIFGVGSDIAGSGQAGGTGGCGPGG